MTARLSSGDLTRSRAARESVGSEPERLALRGATRSAEQNLLLVGPAGLASATTDCEFPVPANGLLSRNDDSQIWISLAWAPCAMSRLAQVCRRSWKRSGASPASSTA